MSNRLLNEPSPYLRQHAHNPVDWYPWGDEARTRARTEDKPILLSIGYSACHWCHVMERESFEDSETAALMNDRFVSVKVDREERPDIDSIYIRAVQAMTGQGGWPLTVVMTPDGVPFFGGTYFPPEPRHGMPAFRQVLTATANAYRDRRDEIERAGREVVEHLRANSTARAERAATEEDWRPLIDRAAGRLLEIFDPEFGGFGRAPKFPQPVNLELLLRHYLRTGFRGSLAAVETTLDRMAAGGMYDRVGGGFHRYSVDAEWIVPHFEKMLYDNALLARVFLQAHRITGERRWATVAEDTLDFVLRELRSPEGAFYSALDADSEDGEGSYYTWTPAELNEVLGEDASWFREIYAVSEGGNFEGRSILHLDRPIAAVAHERGEDPDAVESRLRSLHETLRSNRNGRDRPFRDEKILLGWNGLAIRAFAECGAAFDRPDFIAAAERAALFLLDGLVVEGPLHCWKDGPLPIPAFLEDCAAFGNALISLHEATLDSRWLAPLRPLVDWTQEAFFDPDAGLFFDSSRDGEALILRPRDVMDSALPSGTALMAELLLRHSEIVSSERFREKALHILEGEWRAMESIPTGFGRLISCVDRAHAPTAQIVIVGGSEEERKRLRDRAHRVEFRDSIVLGIDGAPAADIPLHANRTALDGRATAYLCRAFACDVPTTDPEEFELQLVSAAKAQADS